MLDVKKCLKLKNVAVFASGVLFGTAGIKVLGSQDAKKLYINCLAAGLRAKECVMTTASNIQANAEDVLAEAKRSTVPVRKKSSVRKKRQQRISQRLQKIQRTLNNHHENRNQIYGKT